MTIVSFMELSIFRQPLFHHFAWLVAFTKSSQKNSTHLLTVLIIGAIVQLEQRKREIKEKASDPKVQEHNIFDNQKC